MKKLLMILGVLVLLAVVLLPAGVGLLVQSRAQPGLVEDMPDATIDWQRGWTRSTVDVDTEVWRAALRLRHTPLSPPGWLSGEGRVTLLEPPTVVDLQGRVTPGLGLVGRAEAPLIRFDGPVGWNAEQPRVSIELHQQQSVRLEIDIDTVLGADGLGNRLALDEVALEIDLRPEDQRFEQARVDLHLTRAGQPPSRLSLHISRIDREALIRLRQSLEQLMAAEPNSAGASLAMVGVVSAWSELATAGMHAELESLVLDGELQLTGRWTPATREFVLQGGGPAEPALEWAAAIIGLDRAIAPGLARAEAHALLDMLVEQNWISLDEGIITVRVGSA